MVNKKVLYSKGLKEHQIFWIELWEELLNLYTIEPYMTPLKNTATMLKEIKNKDKQDEKKRRLKELKKSDIGLKRDFIAKEIAPHITNLFNINEDNALGLIEEIDYLDENKYFDTLTFKLYKLISSKEQLSEKDLKNIEFLTKIFIAELLNRKFSWYYLQCRPYIFIDSKKFFKYSFQFKVNYLFSNLLRNKEKWSVIFRVTIKKDLSKLVKYQNIKILENADIIDLKEKLNKKLEKNSQKNQSINNDKILENINRLRELKITTDKDIEKIKEQIKFLKNSNKIFIKIENITASDPNSAHRVAQNQLLRFLNIVRYNSPNITFTKNSIDGDVLIENEYNTLLVKKEKYNSPNKNFKREEIIRHLSYIDNSKNPYLKQEFQDIMHFYGMYLDGKYDSERFLSLWIGLEKLCDAKGATIGKTVSNSVSAIVAIYHLRKIIRNIWSDFIRFGLNAELINEFNLSVENEKIEEEELFLIIKFHSDKILEIIKSKTDSRFLYRRVQKLSNIFKKPHTLIEYIHDYKYSVENSIWDLYSIRNKIAHEAYIDAELTLYIKKLEYFFKIVYNNLLYKSSEQNFNSIKEIIQVYENKYKAIWGENGLAYNSLKRIENNFLPKEADKLELKKLLIEPI